MNKPNPNNLVNPVVSDVTSNSVKYVNDGSKVVEFGGDSGIVEIKDTVTVSDDNTYDKHVLTETQNDGEENIIGEFIVGANQITSLVVSSDDNNNNIITVNYINQSGDAGSYELTLPK